jgi:putative FmdB family regulatory protein
MPTYEYHCDGCNHEFDEFQAMKDEPLKKCPKCKKNKLRRLFGTGAALLFKGSGFYETDYRSESYKAAAKADAEAGKPAKSEGTTKESASSSDGAKAPAKPAGKSKSDSSKSST